MINIRTNQSGAAMLIFVIFFLFASVAATYILSRSIYADLLAQRTFVDSKESYFTAIAASEDMFNRYVFGTFGDPVEVISLAGVHATSTVVYDGVADRYTVTSIAKEDRAVRSSEIVMFVTNGVSFNYGMQSGQGGIEMKNSASILGNVHSNGSITGVGNLITGDVISAGPSGLVDGIHATGSVYANHIEAGTIDGDAYYTTINLTDTTVVGDLYPGSPNVATASFPISDDIIFTWEEEAEAAHVYAGPCPLVIDSSTTTISMKVPCDMTVDKNTTEMTITGPIWVEGNFRTQSGPTIKVDPSLVDTIVPIIADDPDDRVDSSKVDINNSTVFEGADGVSHVLVISMNNDDEVNDGAAIAMTAGQSGQGDLILYAPHGRALVGNNGSFTELTAYTIEIINSVQVIFDTGLLNPNFTGGPAATFGFASWEEVE